MAAIRRAASLVAYWDREGLVLRNYVSGSPVGATPLVFEVLERLGQWTDDAALRAAFPTYPRAALRRLIDALLQAHLIERRTGTAAAADPVDGWDAWRPAAGFFHFASRDTPFEPPSVTTPLLRAKASATPPPSPLKTVRARHTIALPPFHARHRVTGETPRRHTLARALRERRTWRQFRAGAVSLDEVSRLLGETWGVQQWVEVPPFGRVALKSSPSGGAQHSVEVYLLAHRVSGLPSGIYHYNPDAHTLGRVRRGLSGRDLEAYLPHQSFYREAAACFVMTSVFERVQWRYPFARAYRTVLAEVGHHCQTLLLLATELGLAPFCTMALADSRLERDLRIDGRTESVLYLAGVGQRPGDVDWAPRPAGERTPARARPTWATRAR